MLNRYITKLVVSILRNNEIARDDIMVVIKTIHDFELGVLKKTKEDYYDMFFSNTLSKLNSDSILSSNNYLDFKFFLITYLFKFLRRKL